MKKIKTNKHSTIWYNKDKQGVEQWTVKSKDKETKTFDNYLSASTYADECSDVDLNIVAIDEQVMLSPKKGLWPDPN